MNRSWTLSTLITANRGHHSPPWTCQVIHADAEPEAFVLDLVALEDCPVDRLGCPSYTPFTMHIVRSEDIGDRCWDELLTAWVALADVVTLRAGETDGTPWLCISTPDQRRLVLEMPSPAAGDTSQPDS